MEVAKRPQVVPPPKFNTPLAWEAIVTDDKYPAYNCSQGTQGILQLVDMQLKFFCGDAKKFWTQDLRNLRIEEIEPGSTYFRLTTLDESWSRHVAVTIHPFKNNELILVDRQTEFATYARRCVAELNAAKNSN